MVDKITNNKSLNLFQDWNANRGSLKSRLVMVLFRLAKLIRNNYILFIIFIWYLVLYKVIVGWILNIEINWNVKVGSDFRLSYGHGSVVEATTEFGNNCTLRQLTTIEHKRLPDGTFSKSPKIGNNVDIGANVTIIGNIKIGDNVTLGAGTVITKSVPANSVMIGNPARLLKMSYSKMPSNFSDLADLAAS